MFPYGYTAAGLRRVNQDEQKPACMYFHPWEIDADQPRLAQGVISKFRTYSGLRTMSHKLDRLLSEFEFGTMADVYPMDESEAPYEAAAVAAN